MIRLVTVLVLLKGIVPAAAASCYTDGQMVTITGTVTTQTAPQNLLRGQNESRYPVVTLNQPLCYKGFVFDDIPAAKTVAVVPIRTLSLPAFQNGSRVTLHGAIYHPVAADRTQQDLVLEFSPP